MPCSVGPLQLCHHSLEHRDTVHRPCTKCESFITAVADQKKKSIFICCVQLKLFHGTVLGAKWPELPSSSGMVSAKNDILSHFMFWNKKWGQFWGHRAFLAQAAHKMANLSTFFSKISFCGEERVQKERFGQVEILLNSPRVFTLHLRPLSAFLWDKCLISLLVRFSSQLVQSVPINIYSASQAVNRDVSARGLHGRCQHARYLSHATFSELWPQFRPNGAAGCIWCEQNSSSPDKGYSTEVLWWRTKPSCSCRADSRRQRDECIIISYKTDIEFGDLGSIREGCPAFAQAVWFGCGRSGWPVAWQWCLSPVTQIR